tara:strand:+ start:1018 stop:1371 length:354 start_codon:yes stop_codon:yes gene_type:complete
MLDRLFIILLMLMTIGCNTPIPKNLEMYEDEKGILYTQIKGDPDIRTPLTGEYQAGYVGEGSDLIKESSNYKNGKLDGIQTLWHADGLKLINTYKNGELVSTEKIHEDQPINNDPPF